MVENFHLKAIPPEFYSAILRSIRDPFDILDRNFRILWANEARAKMHQRKLNDMIGKFCYEMFQRRNEPCPQCPARVVFDSGKSCFMERWVDLPDGSRTWGEIRAYPVLNRNGNVAYAIEIAIDITNKKLANEREERYVGSLEKTLGKLTKKKVQAVLEYEIKKVQADLTEREIQILRLMAEGFSNTRIAEILTISPHTVKTHVIHIFDKLDIRDRTQAVIWASQHKII